MSPSTNAGALDGGATVAQTGVHVNSAESPVEDDDAEIDTISLAIDDRAAGSRLDKVLAERCADLSRSRLQALIKSGQITVNGVTVTKPRHSLASGDEIVVTIPPPDPAEIVAQDIPLDVLHEDEHLIVINKPAGLVVHPAAGNPDGTLVNALLFHCRGQLSGIGGVERPGIVHRLDKETSGCLVAAKTDLAHQSLVGQFANRETEKAYLCVVQGVPAQSSGHLENRIGRHPVSRQKMAVRPEPHGKEAITDYEVLNADPEGHWALVRCVIHTGRTHQIRVHLKECLHCPILGDEIYAQISRQSVKPGRLMLHARHLGFTHPATGERIAFESPLPAAFHPFLPSDLADH
ncbi:MAG: RluA family pseudouridine synthase [Verrucomicrobiae bacterium]|nr:RluA family pseudouridine synthase [Verrucomicrobiae bacterium]